MSAIKLEAYLEGHSLEQAREQARQMSDIGQRAMFVNVKAYRRLGTNEYIVYFAISMWAGENVEALFVNGSEQTL
jgi:hypothetical protein